MGLTPNGNIFLGTRGVNGNTWMMAHVQKLGDHIHAFVCCTFLPATYGADDSWD